MNRNCLSPKTLRILFLFITIGFLITLFTSMNHVKVIWVSDPTIFDAMEALSQVTTSLNVQMSIIEPSILFCLLPSKKKKLLFRRKINFTHFSGHDNLITFGILAKDVFTLEKEESQEKFRAAGFQPHFANVPVMDWMLQQNSSTKKNYFTSHIFYKFEKYFIHAVVFYRRQNYMWHASLPAYHSPIMPSRNKIKYYQHSSAYDNFKFLPTNLELVLPNSEFSVPSHPERFLFQIHSSRFLECNDSIVKEFNTNFTKDLGEHSSLSVRKFNQRTVTALKQLKILLGPLLMNYYIWSGTMLGWYRQCGVIPYTSDVDFGGFADQVDDYDALLEVLMNSKHFKIRERYGMVEKGLEFNLNCYGLRVDLFFLYPEHNGTWYAGHRPSRGYYFKYHHPNFTLCSAELLGERVSVPCETENCIEAEYGPTWIKPVSGWNYETSVYNRGPNIYWGKELEGKYYTSY